MKADGKCLILKGVFVSYSFIGLAQSNLINLNKGDFLSSPTLLRKILLCTLILF